MSPTNTIGNYIYSIYMNCSHCDTPIRRFTKRNDFDCRHLHLNCWKKLQLKQNNNLLISKTFDSMLNKYDLFHQ